MKRRASGTYPTYKQATKRVSTKKGAKPRAGYTSVARTRGAAVTGEMKYFDCDYNTTAVVAVGTDWTGTMADPLTTLNLGSAAVANPLALCVPTVGAALNNRVGRKISVHKIKVRGTIVIGAQAAQAGADSSTKIRILLVQDMQTNAAQMTGVQLLRAGTAATTVINSYQNPDNFGRFRVLKDKLICVSNLNLAGSPTAGDVIQTSFRREFKFNVNFKKPVDVHFNATNGGTVADIVDHSFHLVCGADNIAYAPFLTYYSRVCYKDT